jgi:hypothetical protein
MKKSVLTNHHILPRSRGGSDDKSNIARIVHKEHDLYHQLFGNKTPEEILDYLVNYFWLSQDKRNGMPFVIRFKNKEMR